MSEEQFKVQNLSLSRKTRGWWRVLLTGIAAYWVGMSVLLLTGNPILFPTVVMIGSFTVPVAYVAFFYERRHLSRLNMPVTAKGFLYGGVLGVFAAAVLEPFFVGQLNYANAFLVGLIEEFAKILGVLFIARRLRHDMELDGLILGAAAGMGFASIESNGYAFVAFMSSGGNISAAVGMTLIRGLLSPIGHGTWTAIFAAVLFREADSGRFRINRRVIGAYLTVSILHGLLDGIPVVISTFLSPGFYIFGGEIVVGTLGFIILWRKWQEAKRLQLEKIFSS